MATTTTRLSLRKPDPTPVTGDFVDAGADLNANWDKVDGAMPFFPCTSGTRPGSPFTGMQIHETDTKDCLYWNGTVWRRMWVEGQSSRWPEAILFQRAAAANPILSGRVTGDTQDRSSVRADGVIDWGVGGAAAPDTNIYRNGVSQLKTDDAFVAVGSITGAQFLPTIAAGYMYSQTIRYTANGNFLKASYAGIRAVIVSVQGGGGGGGGTSATAGGTVSASCGGSGGGFVQVFIPASSLAASETVTVGTAGAAGVAGVVGVAGNGSASSFGTFAVGGGGGGGEGVGPTAASSAANPGVPGEWSAAGTGVVVLDHFSGEYGVSGMQKGVNVGSGGPGGAARLGQGGRISVTNTGGPGVAPLNAGTLAFGGGGGAAWADVSQAQFAGGAGAQGVVYVTILI